MMTWDQKQKKRWTAKRPEEYFGGDGNVLYIYCGSDFHGCLHLSNSSNCIF